MARPLHISQTEIDIQARKIFLPAKYGESGVGLCYPGCKIGYNLSAFLDSPVILSKYLGKYYKRFQFIPVELESKSSLKSFNADVWSLLTHQGLKVSRQAKIEQMVEKLLVQGKEPYFFILNGQVVRTMVLREILSQIHDLIERYPRVGGMVFIERNILEKPYQLIFQDNHKFLQNIEYFPIYSEGVSRYFLQTLAHEWRIKISEKTIKEMVNQCGGILWLLREALRRVRDEGEKGIKDLGKLPGIQMRLRTIIATMSAEEVTTVAALCFRSGTFSSDYLRDYLLKIRLIDKFNSGYKLTCPLLAPSLEQRLTIGKMELTPEGQIWFGKKELSLVLTEVEQAVLKVLLDKRGKIVSRESIAQVIWEREWAEKYSDWALDQVISRLRRRLAGLGLPKSTIQTKKGMGWVIE